MHTDFFFILLRNNQMSYKRSYIIQKNHFLLISIYKLRLYSILTIVHSQVLSKKTIDYFQRVAIISSYYMYSAFYYFHKSKFPFSSFSLLVVNVVDLGGRGGGGKEIRNFRLEIICLSPQLFLQFL